MSVCLSLIIFPALTTPLGEPGMQNQPWLGETLMMPKSSFLLLPTYFCGRLAHLLKVLSHYGGTGFLPLGRYIWLPNWFTGIGLKVVPRMRESRLLTPSGRGKRVHILAEPCTYTVSEEGCITSSDAKMYDLDKYRPT